MEITSGLRTETELAVSWEWMGAEAFNHYQPTTTNPTPTSTNSTSTSNSDSNSNSNSTINSISTNSTKQNNSID